MIIGDVVNGLATGVGIDLSPQGDIAYYLEWSIGELCQLEVDTGKVKRVKEGFYFPQDVLVDWDDTKEIYVSERTGDIFKIRSDETSEIMTSINGWPHQLALVKEGGKRYLFTVCYDSGYLVRIDLDTKNIRTIVGGLGHPVGLVVDSCQKYAYITEQDTSSLKKIELISGNVEILYKGLVSPFYLAWDKNETGIFCTQRDPSNSLVKIHLGHPISAELIASDLAWRPSGVAPDKENNKICICADQKIQIISSRGVPAIQPDPQPFTICSIEFDHNKNGAIPFTDHINDNDIPIPEWVKDLNGKEPTLYARGAHPVIKVVFSKNPGFSGGSYAIGATGNLGGVMRKNVNLSPFTSGMRDYGTFKLMWPLNYDLDKKDVFLEWYARSTENPAVPIPLGSTHHTICTIWKKTGWSYYQPYPEYELNTTKLAAVGMALQKDIARPKISLILNAKGKSSKIIGRSINSLTAQMYRDWELFVISDGSIDHPDIQDSRVQMVFAREGNDVIDQISSRVSGGFVGLIGPGDELVPQALAEIILNFREYPDSDIIYPDELLISEDGRPRYALYRPDYSEDFLLSAGYISHFVVARREIIHWNSLSLSDYEDILAIFPNAENVVHIPKILYLHRETPEKPGYNRQSAIENYIGRKGIDADVIPVNSCGIFRIKRKIKGDPKITIIIPTRDNIPMLKRCIESTEQRSSYKNFEFIIVNNQSHAPESLDYLKYLREKSSRYSVLEYPEEFNYSAINNFAARHASGEHLLFLNNDLEVISPGWLEAMLEHSQRDDVACVGARLLYPDGRVQHAGVIVGLFEVADHTGKYAPRNSMGYLNAFMSVRDYSAVTAACMMIKKNLFLDLSGFDESIFVGFGDTDLCLRAKKRGYRNIYTPYAELYHSESATRGRSTGMDPHPEDTFIFRHRWEAFIDEGDPFYNPNLPRDTYFPEQFAEWNQLRSPGQSIKTRDQIILEMAGQVKSLEQSVKTRDQIILEMAGQVKSLEQSVTARDQIVLETTNQVKSLEQSVIARDQIILETTNQVKSLEQSVTARDQIVLETTNQVKSLEQSVIARDQIILETTNQVKSLEQSVTARDQIILDMTNQVQVLQQEKSSIEKSIVWQFVTGFHRKVVTRVLPLSTRRRHLYDLGLKGGRILVNEGWESFWLQYKEYRSMKNK